MVQRKKMNFLFYWYSYFATTNIKSQKSHLQDTTDFIHFIEKIKMKKPNVAERFLFRFEKCLDQSTKKILSSVMKSTISKHSRYRDEHKDSSFLSQHFHGIH